MLPEFLKKYFQILNILNRNIIINQPNKKIQLHMTY